MTIQQTIRKAEAWMDEHDGVIGVAQGERDGRPVVEVFVKDRATADHLPPELDGYPVVTVLSDEFASY
jgi:hypothetical protein